MLTRRHFIISSAALFSAPLVVPAAAQDAVTFDFDARVTRHERAGRNPWGLHERYMPTRVAHRDGMRPGDIHVDPVAKYLYLIEEGGTAIRYGVAVGRQGLQSPGSYRIQRKEEWPSWTPTANMIRREPQVYAQFAGGVPGGLGNPLGARALYLYRGGRDTMLRIHGTPQPWTIGTSASSGCVRLVNDHIIQVYDQVPLGTRVVLHSPWR